jgi:phosphopantothenoylcysteine decarboxylase/phosphopantothenate--cysteine ligase
MRCLITCGPTYQPLDNVRRLTNFSTGRLGIGLANYLRAAGHDVLLLKGYYATCPDPFGAKTITFTTNEDLLHIVRGAAKDEYDAVFHAAAVSDFAFGAVYKRLANDTLQPVTSGKFGTRDGNLLVELVPTPKIIRQLRALFPAARIVGWKYEVDGSRESAIGLGQNQIIENETNYSVVNGPTYGDGFGIVSGQGLVEHCSSAEPLYQSLEAMTCSTT